MPGDYEKLRNCGSQILKVRNRNSATFKEMLLRNRNAAIPQSQFFLKSATSSPQLGSFNSAIFGIFLAVESGQFMEKKSEAKNLMLLSLKGKFLLSRETEDSKIFLVDF